MITYRETIQTDVGEDAGCCYGYICSNPDELTEVSKQNFAYGELRHVMQDLEFPVAYFFYVEVKPEYQRRGLASKAAKEFETFAQLHAAKTIVLKAAFDDDDEMEWKPHLYAKLGYAGFDQEHLAFPVMYKYLRA